jgi:hypothetical protein
MSVNQFRIPNFVGIIIDVRELKIRDNCENKPIAPNSIMQSRKKFITRVPSENDFDIPQSDDAFIAVDPDIRVRLRFDNFHISRIQTRESIWAPIRPLNDIM